MFVTRLTCFACGLTYPHSQPINLCTCGKPLRVDYDLEAVGKAVKPADLIGRPANLWRYREVLPLPFDVEPPTLGEGFTPLLPADSLGGSLGLNAGSLLIKDEGVNPTGSFKARGMAVAVAMAAQMGLKKLAVPSAGNAGGALAAYAARCGIEAHIFMPKDVPAANILECQMAGAHVTLVDGLITDCAKIVMSRKEEMGWFDMSTLKEPYRVEGKKTMGYEIAEQLGWVLPDVVLYPTGGGTGLVGMWKAFDEMEQLGWIGAKRPRMISVQAFGCAPIEQAFHKGLDHAPEFENAYTVAAGLRVPKAIADFVMLDLLRKSGGTAIRIHDKELIANAREMSAATGICSAPEGGACLAALKRLIADGKVKANEKVVLFNTGTGVKYAEAFAAFPE
ncbi:MAG: threonine synthase [Chthonomonadales bacterium]